MSRKRKHTEIVLHDILQTYTQTTQLTVLK